MAFSGAEHLLLDVDNSRPPGRACDARNWRSSIQAALPSPIGAALLLVQTLTARELTVFRLLGVGYDNRAIARTLSISERTVKRHVTAILIKLGLESRLQAGLAAMAMAMMAAGPGNDCARDGGGARHAAST